MPRNRNTEVDAYVFIKENLKNIGWIVKNPLRSQDGQVFTQGECLAEPRIAEQLGQTKPENIVKISETEYYVIESKASRSEIGTAVNEAEKYYAEPINRSRHIKAKIISGVAGNDNDGYIVKSKFMVNGVFKPIISNEKELTSLVSPAIAKYLLEKNTNIIEELPIDEKLFLETAEKINVLLHNGAIAATERGKVMSALLLSLIDETQPNLNASPSILVSEINARVNAVLQKEGKPEFYEYIKMSLPTTQENHIKFKTAIVKTIQELNNLNIRSAMNSGADVLGNFYEVFLKYGNWAKEIGIVLTPRHITKFSAEILDINKKDLIFDPTCGTGGFLVATFDYVKKNSSEHDIKTFKENNIFGIEQEPSVVALAIVNMIFRGDGKNNIKEANCFSEFLNLKREGNINTAEYTHNTKNLHPPITKVLMNPPFALKEDQEKEYKFVNHALEQMQNGGLLFTVLPTAEMLARGQYKEWRETLLAENTLIAVITFPSDVFYPIGINTIGVIVKKGMPHPRQQKVLWLRAIHDGFVKRKGKRLKPKPPLTERDILTEYKEKIKEFVKDQSITIRNAPEVCKLEKIDFEDTSLELVPELYLDETLPTENEVKDGIEQLVRETAGYLLTMNKQDINIKQNKKQIKSINKTKRTKLIDLCKVERKYAPYINELLSDEKTTPYVTTTETQNGISIRCDTEPNFPKYTVTVSLDGTCGTTFFQFENYIAGEKTAVLELKQGLNIEEKYKIPLLFYIAYLIRRMSWRYHYGRKLSEERLQKFELPLPINENEEINYSYIKEIVENSYGWEVIKENIQKRLT